MEGDPATEPEPEKPPRRVRRNADTPRKPIDEVAAESQARVAAKTPRQARSRKKTPTANERFINWAERHLEDARQERDRLRMELVEVRTNHDLAITELMEKHQIRLAAAHERLLEIEPNYEGLIRDHANLLDANLFTLVLTGFGASLISGAGYAPNPIFVTAILFTGITMFVAGSAQQIATTWRNRKSPPRARPQIQRSSPNRTSNPNPPQP